MYRIFILHIILKFRYFVYYFFLLCKRYELYFEFS